MRLAKDSHEMQLVDTIVLTLDVEISKVVKTKW